MDMKSVIAQLTAERDRIDGVIKLLSATGSAPTGKRRGRPPLSAASPVAAPKKRKMSAAGRKRIAEAQRKRWATLKQSK
ncbi:MAG: hypothetical protein V4555_14920 [Acidobacteriota bacterium]